MFRIVTKMHSLRDQWGIQFLLEAAIVWSPRGDKLFYLCWGGGEEGAVFWFLFPCPGKGAHFHGIYLMLSCLILSLFFYPCSYSLEFYHFYHDITDILYKFKVYMWWFDIWVYFRMIIIIKLINTSIASQLPFMHVCVCVCVCRTLKIYSLQLSCI